MTESQNQRQSRTDGNSRCPFQPFRAQRQDVSSLSFFVWLYTFSDLQFALSSTFRALLLLPSDQHVHALHLQRQGTLHVQPDMRLDNYTNSFALRPFASDPSNAIQHRSMYALMFCLLGARRSSPVGSPKEECRFQTALPHAGYRVISLSWPTSCGGEYTISPNEKRVR